MSYFIAACGLSGLFQRVFVILDILRAVIGIDCQSAVFPNTRNLTTC